MKTNKWTHILCMGLIVALGVQLGACSSKKEKKAETNQSESTEPEADQDVVVTERQMKTVGIRLGKIEKRSLSSVVRANGELGLDPQMKADVNSLVGGVIRKILVIEGKHVSRGQTVALLENTQIVELQNKYLVAMQNRNLKLQEFARQRELSVKGAGTQKYFQQAQADYAMAKAEVTGLKQQLRQLAINPQAVAAGRITTMIPIKSSIEGNISKINVSIGSYVDIQTPIMNVTDNSKIHCDFKVFEKDIKSVHAGQTVDIMLTNQPNVRLKGVIYEMNKSFENETKSIIVHTRITSKHSTTLFPGMYVTGLIDVGVGSVNAVPDDAIVKMGSKSYIFYLVDKKVDEGKASNHFKRMEVITGTQGLGYTQISTLGVLPPSTVIIKNNAFYLASMMSKDED